MSFSYQFGANPAIDYVRLLIADTDPTKIIFQDAEITMATQLQACQFQSAQFFSGAMGANLPASPVSYLRIAALLLDALASNQARLSGLVKILDVEMSTRDAAKALREQAQAYRDTDDNAGAFMIIEQVNDTFSFRDRFWKQVQRQQAGGFL